MKIHYFKRSIFRFFYSLSILSVLFVYCSTNVVWAATEEGNPLTGDALKQILIDNTWSNYTPACNGGRSPGLTAGSGEPEGASFPKLDPDAMINGINKYIEQANPNSKMKGLGSTIVAGAKNSNVNPFLIIAIAQKESSLSDPSDYNVRNGSNSFGRTATSSQPHFEGARTWYKWNSVKASVDHTDPSNKGISGGGDFAAYLRNQYPSQINKDDLVSLMMEYAPPSENDTQQYIADIKAWVKKMIDLSKPGSTDTPNIASPSAADDQTQETDKDTAASDNGDTIGTLPPKSQRVFDAAKPAINKLQSVYEYGAQKTGIKWQYLAALHYREANNRPGTSIFAGEPLGGPNPDGATGTGSTPNDNAVAAANHFIEMAKSVYGVDPRKDQSFEDLQKAFLAYNRGFIYKWGNVAPDKSPYVMSGYDDAHALPMSWPVLPPASQYTELPGSDARLGAMAIVAGLGAGASGGGSCDSTGAANSAAGCDQIGQLDNKFTFPLCTTQKSIKAGVSYNGTIWVWCYTKTTSCHHDYAAADIHEKEGTTVIAATGGTVYSAKDPGSCSGGFEVPRVQIKADNGKFYYYTHMKPGSLKVKDGQKVNPGDQIGVIGPPNCAQNTGPHLHIHRASGPIMCAGTPGCSQHADYDRNDIQPDLHEAYQKLPEE